MPHSGALNRQGNIFQFHIFEKSVCSCVVAHALNIFDNLRQVSLISPVIKRIELLKSESLQDLKIETRYPIRGPPFGNLRPNLQIFGGKK